MMEDVNWNDRTIGELKEILNSIEMEVLTIVDEDGEHVVIIAKKESAQNLIKELEEVSEWIE